MTPKSRYFLPERNFSSLQLELIFFCISNEVENRWRRLRKWQSLVFWKSLVRQMGGAAKRPTFMNQQLSRNSTFSLFEILCTVKKISRNIFFRCQSIALLSLLDLQKNAVILVFLLLKNTILSMSIFRCLKSSFHGKYNRVLKSIPCDKHR